MSERSTSELRPAPKDDYVRLSHVSVVCLFVVVVVVVVVVVIIIIIIIIIVIIINFYLQMIKTKFN